MSSMSKYLFRVLKGGGFLLTSPPQYPHVGQYPESFPPQGAGRVRDFTEGLVAGGPLSLPPPLAFRAPCVCACQVTSVVSDSLRPYGP